eukprot:3751-Heterococcus_DN1.PRE.1
MIVTSHIQIGLSNSGVKPNEDQWGAWIGLPTWLSAIIWPLSASHSGAHIGIRVLTFCTGYGLSMSCSRRNMSFSTMKEYTGFVKTRLHRLLLLCYISTAVFVLQDMTNGTFEFTNKEHWIDLVLTLTFTSQFTSKYFFPRENGVMWFMGFIIISCIISFPILHAAMRKVGKLLPYTIATVVAAVVRYYGVLYYPDLQLSAIHHPISSSFVGFLSTIAAGMVCYHLTVKANNMYQSLSITAKCRTVVLRWSLFAIGYGVISYMAYRRDVMHHMGWFRHIDSSSWHSFVLQ